MKKNKIYHGYHHEDLTLKFLKENTTKYIAKITGAEFCDEINVELINLKPKVLRIDYGIKKKDKIILYEFLSTKSNIANILRRIFLYVARIGYDYQLKVKINLVVTPEIDKNQVVLEYSPGQFFRPEVISFKDYDGDKLLSNITYKVKNNIKLTCNEFLALGILPLMKTKHEAGVQVVKTLELARKITDIDDELKDSVLGILIVLADKFIENQDLKNKVIDVIKMEITILHDYVTSHEKEWLEQGKIEGKLEGKEEEKLKIAKNIYIALILTFILTGLGSIYAGNTKKGLTLLILRVLFAALAFFSNIFGILSVLVWVYGFYEVYNDVQIANRNSSPNLINDFKNWNQQNKIIAILIICAILILTLNSLISFSSTDSYPSDDSDTSNYVSYSYESPSSHYRGVDTSPDTLAKNDPDSYYDYYEYGDNPDVDNYLESEGYD